MKKARGWGRGYKMKIKRATYRHIPKKMGEGEDAE